MRVFRDAQITYSIVHWERITICALIFHLKKRVGGGEFYDFSNKIDEHMKKML